MEVENPQSHGWQKLLAYINADDIKKSSLCTDMEAAIKAEELREKALFDKIDFTFETVLSTDRNLNLLKRARENGYFIRGIYVLTASSEINIVRVKVREASGGHGVPEDKIRSRYDKDLALVPELVQICDILHIYDNSENHLGFLKSEKMYIIAGRMPFGMLKLLRRSLV